MEVFFHIDNAIMMSPNEYVLSNLKKFVSQWCSFHQPNTTFQIVEFYLKNARAYYQKGFSIYFIKSGHHFGDWFR